MGTGITAHVILILVHAFVEVDGEVAGAVVLAQDLVIGGIVAVSQVEADEGGPGGIVEGGTGGVVQLDGLEVVGIDAFDAVGDGLDEGAVAGVVPGLEVVAMEPDQVGGILVAVAEEDAVVVGFGGAVSLEDTQPVDGLDGGEEDGEVVVGGQGEDVVEAGEVGGVGSGEVIGGGEGRDAIVGGTISAARGIGLAAQGMDPDGVEAGGLAIGEEGLGVGFGESAEHGLGGVAADEERGIILVDQIALVAAHLQRIYRTA